MVSSCGEKKQTKGRQKIEIRPISKPSARHVTFTKRRGGLFSKADELAELCGAHVGIIAFSPGNKPFIFGPEVLDQFITSSTGCHAVGPQDATSEEEIRKEIDELTAKLVLGRQITEKQIFFGTQVRAMQESLMGRELGLAELQNIEVGLCSIGCQMMDQIVGLDAHKTGQIADLDANSVTSQIDQIPFGYNENLVTSQIDQIPFVYNENLVTSQIDQIPFVYNENLVTSQIDQIPFVYNENLFTSQIDQIPFGYNENLGMLDQIPVSLAGPDLLIFPSYSDFGGLCL